MARKRTPRQQLVDLYDQMLMEYLQNAYSTHCTAGKREVEAAYKALQADYKECMRKFREKLDDVIFPLEEEIDQVLAEAKQRWQELRNEEGGEKWDVLTR